MKRYIFPLLFVVALCFSFVDMPTVDAASSSTTCQGRGRSLFILTSWDAYLPCRDGIGVYIDSLQSASGLVFWVIDSLLKLSTYIAIGFVIWGSIKIIKAQGEPSEFADAKETILKAIIGLGICISSVAIVQFVSGGF